MNFIKKLLLILVLFSTLGLAQEKNDLQVDSLDICTSVMDRKPVGVDSVFSDQVERLYCFTVILGTSEPTIVTHVWYYEDKELARQELAVKAKRWRTWSSKRIVAEWTGNWRVDIIGPNSQILKSTHFQIKSN